MSFQMFNAPLSKGDVVMHSCDNGLCVNPSHLSAGTIRENTIDMFSKGRSNNFFMRCGQSGESNANAKLTKETANEIRKFYEKHKCTFGKLADEFGLKSRGHAHAIVIGRIWK
jgi:hypothetical protein